MIKKIIKSMDYSIIVITIILFVIGIIALYSANGGIEGDISETIRQLIWFGVGFVLAFIVILIDFDMFGKLWVLLYGLMILSLVRCIIYSTGEWS